MLHIFRQIIGLRKFDTFVITKQRQNAGQFPFADLEILHSKKFSLLQRAALKYLHRQPALVYRGEFEAVRRILIRRDPDLMHIYFGNTGVHLLPLIERWDRPCVVSFHGMDVQRRHSERGYEEKLRRLLRLVRLVLVRSNSLAIRLIDLGCSPEQIRLNRTGIPLENFPYAPRTTPEDGAWTVVQACRLVPKKGLTTALQAFQIFHSQYPNSRFVIAGDGPLRPALNRLVSDLKLDKAVEFTGFVTQTELYHLYRSAHLFLHPSEVAEDGNEEGVPNSLLEAMASGLPVIATKHGGIPEAVTDQVTGFLFSEKDKEGIAEALTWFAKAPAEWARMSREASRAVALNFEHRQQIDRLESIYFEALEQPCLTK